MNLSEIVQKAWKPARKVWKPGILLGVPTAGAILGDSYAVLATDHIYSIIDYLVDIANAERTYNFALLGVRALGTGVLGAPAVRYASRAIFGKPKSADSFRDRFNRGYDRWLRSAVVAGVIGSTAITGIEAGKPVVSNKLADLFGDVEAQFVELLPEAQKIELKEADINSLTNALRTDSNFVVSFLRDKWFNMYTSEPLQNDLENAVLRSSNDVAAAKYVFFQEGIPVEYALLGIPESHWITKASSPAKARGVYQFMPKTAKKYGGIITEGYDSRLHPLESARMAAKFLNDLYADFNQDWNLALAAYNSGMPYIFRKNQLNDQRYGDGTVSFENYLIFLAKWLEDINSSNENKGKIEVRKGDTIDGLLTKYAIPVNEENRVRFMDYNNISKPRDLRMGQDITIPSEFLDENTKQALNYRRAITKREKFIRENLNYPPKLFGILEILAQEYPDYLDTRPAPPPYDIRTITGSVGHHTVVSGQTLYGIGKQHNVPYTAIQDANGIPRNKTNIHPGQVLIIPGGRPSFKEFANSLGLNYEELLKHNPHVLNIRLALPNGARIYIPKE